MVYDFLPGSLTGSSRVEGGEVGTERTPELRGVSNNAASTLTLDDGLRYPHDTLPLLVREEHTYICLRLPTDQQAKALLTPRRGANATFDATLEVSPYALRAHRDHTGQFTDSGSTNGVSFEGAVGKFSRQSNRRRAR